MQRTDLDESRGEMEEFFRSFMLYEYPILDPNSRYHVIFRRLLETLNLIGDRLKQEFPDHLVALGLRGSYSHGHPYEGNDVDVLFMGEDLTGEIQEVMLRIAGEELAPREFELCRGKVEMGIELQPIRFLDLNGVEAILKSYMYGLANMLYEGGHDEKEEAFVGRSRLAEKKRVLLHSGILIPYLLWVYGLENVSRVFRGISQYLPIPTRPLPLFGADVIDETKETIKQAYIARTLTGRPIHLTMATGYEVPGVEDEDYGSAVHREAEALFWALRPLKGIYREAVNKHIIQAKLEMEVVGRRLSPERILTFAPSYNGLVRRRLRAQWGKWINW
jgi:hypothetical protein